MVNCNEYLLYDPYIGDVNGDQEVNIADINAVIGMILSGAPEPSGDANRDGEVNIADINVIIQAILNHWLSDFSANAPTPSVRQFVKFDINRTRMPN